MAYQVNMAPPVNTTSVIFIAASIAIMEINDMPAAVRNALRKGSCFSNITVSSAIEVNSPFIMASIMIAKVDHPELVQTNWK